MLWRRYRPWLMTTSNAVLADAQVWWDVVLGSRLRRVSTMNTQGSSLQVQRRMPLGYAGKERWYDANRAAHCGRYHAVPIADNIMLCTLERWVQTAV